MYSTAVLKIDSASKNRANWLRIPRNSAIFGQNSANFRQFTHINFNLFHYAGNNPVKYVDPDGRFPKISNILYYQGSSSTVYTGSNPINQESFDLRYGFSSASGTVSCKTNSLINIYAAKFSVTQSQLDNVVAAWISNDCINDDGSPIDINKMSKILAKELGLNKYYSFIYPKENDYNQLQFSSQEDFEKSSYDAGIQTRTKPGYTHYTATVKNGKESIVLDSLKADRTEAENYSVVKVEPMTLYTLPAEESK